MNFNITADSNWEAKIDKVLYALQDTGCQPYFEKRDYGKSIYGIGVVLMCRDPYLNFKQRIRFDKKTQWLSIDIMLDFDLFKQITLEEKNKIVAEKFIAEIPPIIAKYKFKDFDLIKFKADLSKFMKKLIPPSGL